MRKHLRGFTLIEIMTVIVLIVMLAAIGIKVIATSMDLNATKQSQMLVQQTAQAVQEFIRDEGMFPNCHWWVGFLDPRDVTTQQYKSYNCFGTTRSYDKTYLNPYPGGNLHTLGRASAWNTTNPDGNGGAADIDCLLTQRGRIYMTITKGGQGFWADWIVWAGLESQPVDRPMATFITSDAFVEGGTLSGATFDTAIIDKPVSGKYAGLALVLRNTFFVYRIKSVDPDTSKITVDVPAGWLGLDQAGPAVGSWGSVSIRCGTAVEL